MFSSILIALFKIFRWKVDPVLPEGTDRCVMIAAPHTSNWDFVFMRAAFDIMKVPMRYTVKSELKKFPMRQILEPLGAIWIDRSPKKPGGIRLNMVDAMTALFKENDKIAVVVTPEGTRSRRETWKTGFYHVALQAKVPIALGYLDYKKRLAGVGKMIWPSGDMEKDMREIMAFYATIHPKFPEKFSLDINYSDNNFRQSAM